MLTSFPKEVSWDGPNATYRTPRLEDAPEIRVILSDLDNMKYLKFMTKPGGWTEEQVRERLGNQLKKQEDNQALVLHIIRDGKVVGMTGFTVIDLEHGHAEVGIILDKSCWGKNIATEAFYFSLKWIFEEVGIHRVQWVTTRPNVGMRGWLEKVCGLQPEAINKEVWRFDDQWVDQFCYAVLEDEWRNTVKGTLYSKIYKK
jgi:RimJ/RimL family protein N-acetyltransferase